MTYNFHQIKTFLILFVTALTFIPAGCKKQTPPSAVQEQAPPPPKKEESHVTTVETLVIEPGVGIGPIKFGASKEEVIKNFSQPDKIEGNGAGLNYISSKGLSFLVHPSGGVRVIDCWSKEYPFPFVKISHFAGKTKEGIAMGATREQIVAAYGEPDEVTNQDPMIMLHYIKLRTNFMIWQNKLVNIKMEGLN